MVIGSAFEEIRGVDISTLPVLDRPLLSPDVIILFVNLDTGGESI